MRKEKKGERTAPVSDIPDIIGSGFRDGDLRKQPMRSQDKSFMLAFQSYLPFRHLEIGSQPLADSIEKKGGQATFSEDWTSIG